MVRFSCFHGENHSDKRKNIAQNTAEARQRTMEDFSKDLANVSDTSSLHSKLQLCSNCTDHVADSSVECDLKSERNNYFARDLGAYRIGYMKKCMSLGSALDMKGKVPSGNELEAETDKEYSCDGSNDHSPSLTRVHANDYEGDLPGLSRAPCSDSVKFNSDTKNLSTYSAGGQLLLENVGDDNSDSKLSNHVSNTSLVTKSRSFPNLASSSELSFAGHVVTHSKSYDDLNVLTRGKILVDEIGGQLIQDHERDAVVLDNEPCVLQNNGNKSDNACDYDGSDWKRHGIDEKYPKNLNAEPLLFPQVALPNEDFKRKRIQEWIVGLQNCSPIREIDEVLTFNGHQAQDDDTALDGLTAARLDVKVSPAMEAAKKYVSSLAATATTAQLATQGLTVIPFLSAFLNLRALNLSGNYIVRITAGALPRGLHVLNLSKNHISVIEGLRELTRLRVLDLSYNRIFRIAHGLSSCTSLKELYLAGNKISEVEGLHRLLKLNLLDLRSNKISTSKCLGQLAAHYNSLHTIRLEGNPAQNNVGDEQLRKYLQGLLPHLSYYNTQPMKAGTLKDASDSRSSRFGIGFHQIDRSLRSDLKAMRKGNHGRKTQASHTRNSSRSRHVVFPLSRTQPAAADHQQNSNDYIGKLLGEKAKLFMRRSRSEGNLGAL